MKVLITGGSGMLGFYLNREFSTNHEILTLRNNGIGNSYQYNNAKVDLTNEEEIKSVINNFQPDVIIHSAALSNPSLANNIPKEMVFEINVNATEYLAKYSSEIGAKIIYLSTDLIYDGNKGSLLKENGELNPISIYAETKLTGEEKVKKYSNSFLILRLSLQCEIKENSNVHFSKIFYSLKNKERVKLFIDQYRTPLAAFDSARMIRELTELKIENEIINFGGKERLSRYFMAEILCDEAGFSKSFLIKTSLKDFVGVNQVADVSMNTEKLNSLGITQINFRESVKKMINKL